MNRNWIKQMDIMVRHYLSIEPSDDLDQLVEQYVAALWIEERQVDAMAAAIAKAFKEN